MESSKSVGRITGILLLVHLAGGLMLPYILMQPAIAAPGFLENAAANAVRIRAAVLLLFMSGAITVAVALTALPVFRRYGDRLAVLLVVLSAVNLALHAVENGTLLSMLSLSQEYAERGGADASLFHGLAAVVGSARRWAHFTHLLVVGSWIFTLFTVLWRSSAGSASARRSRDAGDRPPGDRGPVAGNPRPGSRDADGHAAGSGLRGGRGMAHVQGVRGAAGPGRRGSHASSRDRAAVQFLPSRWNGSRTGGLLARE